VFGSVVNQHATCCIELSLTPATKKLNAKQSTVFADQFSEMSMVIIPFVSWGSRHTIYQRHS